MGYRKVTPGEQAEVLRHLEALEPEGGTWLDIFKMSQLSESTIRTCLTALGREKRAIRKARPEGPGRGRQPDLWRAAGESEEREDA